MRPWASTTPCATASSVRGAVVQRDDARLIANRLQRTIPIVDEVITDRQGSAGYARGGRSGRPGHTIRTLSNTYGLATVFGLDHEETRMVAPVRER